MQIKDYRCKCGCNDFFFIDKCNQKGIYCTDCGRWFKWADKNEQNLAMNQEPVLDRIRAEIEELKPNNPNFKGYFEQNVALNKVLEIIDKYKAEVDPQESEDNSNDV